MTAPLDLRAAVATLAQYTGYLFEAPRDVPGSFLSLGTLRRKYADECAELAASLRAEQDAGLAMPAKSEGQEACAPTVNAASPAPSSDVRRWRVIVDRNGDVHGERDRAYARDYFGPLQFDGEVVPAEDYERAVRERDQYAYECDRQRAGVPWEDAEKLRKERDEARLALAAYQRPRTAAEVEALGGALYTQWQDAKVGADVFREIARAALAHLGIPAEEVAT